MTDQVSGSESLSESSSELHSFSQNNLLTDLDIREIMRLLPHRYPFILVDRVLELRPHESIRAIKNVSMNEPYFQGHFPGYPVMPGVLLLEAMAQTMALLAFKSFEQDGIVLSENEVVYYVGVDNARFRRPVVPGDQVVFEANMGKSKRGIWKSTVIAKVAGELVCSADLMAAHRAPDKN